MRRRGVNDARRTGENEAPGCLTVPALIVVVPIRLLWELLVLIRRAVARYVLRPLGWLVYQGLVRPIAWLFQELWELLVLIGRGVARYVLRPVAWLVYQGLVRPVAWLVRLLLELLALIGRAVGRYVLRPLGWLVYQGLIRPVAWLFQVLVVSLRWLGAVILAPLGRAVYRYLLRPIGLGLACCVRIVLRSFAYAAAGIGRGLAAVWRAAWPLLAALGRGIAHVWRLAGIVLFHLLVRPVRWVWRTLLLPVFRAVAWVWRVTVLTSARWARVNVLKPAGAAVRSAFRALGLDTRRP